MALLAIGRRRELRDLEVPRVELRRQAPDRAALAGRVPTLEQDQQRRTDVAVADQSRALQSQRQQPLLGALEPLDALALESLSDRSTSSSEAIAATLTAMSTSAEPGPEDAGTPPTFDQELLSWLGDETPRGSRA